MKSVFLRIAGFLMLWLTLSPGWFFAQNTCTSPAVLTDGGCTTISIVMNTSSIVTSCNGGNHPRAFMKIVAPANGDCVQLDFSGHTAGGTFQFATYTNNCASYVTNSAACVGNVDVGQPFTYSSEGITGSNLLTPGQTYIVAVQSDVPCTITVCMQTPSGYATRDECSGAQQIGTAATTLYNGGDCTYSGSLDNASSDDPPAAQLCAGSLENTQWTSFIAQAASIQIIGSGINCTGGGCGFQFGIFTGTCDSLNHLGCYGNKVCSGGQSISGPTNPAGQITWSGTGTSGFTATIFGLSVGEKVYLAMDGNADADCTYTLAGMNVFAVPVELIRFNGTWIDEAVLLSWATASEQNNSFFSIERSEDNSHFVEVGRVAGGYNSTELMEYEFRDESVIKGMSYYRLVQVDFDGNRTYSATISVRPSNTQPLLVKRINMLGAEISLDEIPKGLVIEIYNDQSVRKVWYQ